MRVYNCIIVEDEPIAAEIISDYIAEIPFLHLSSVHHNALSALNYLNEHAVDLIFLDINLPKIKGLDFLKSLKNPPMVIITTAYDEYALKGYEYNVIDYLLKPIEFARFLQAVNKISDKNVVRHSESVKEQEAFIQLSVQKKIIRINLNDILYIESNRENIHIQTNDKLIICKMQIGEIEKLLDSTQFLRVHRSFIVSLNKVNSMSLTEFEIKNYKIPIGRNYREQVRKFVHSQPR
jgi:DNA-binding LytR/AlgR family response regulator